MEDSSVRCKAQTFFTLSIVTVFIFFGCTGKVPPNKHTTPVKDSSSASMDTGPGNVISYDSTKRYIYITLDDGPQNGTMHCYQIAKKLGVKASFFMIGVQVYEQQIMNKVDSIRNGYPQFLLCNHTYTHANHSRYASFYGNTDSALRDIEKNQHGLAIPLKIMRMPGHNSWAVNGRIRTPGLPKELCNVMDSSGYKVAGWDVEWHFKNYSTPVESVEKMISEVARVEKDKELFNRNHIVILAHDRMFEKQQYADSLQKFIAILKQDPKNVFETIDHYPGMPFK